MDSPEALLQSAGEPKTPLDATTPDDPFVCDICLDEFGPEELFELRCRHPFCKPCWSFYVADKIKSEGDADMKCMKDKCPATVDEPSIASLVDESTFSRFVVHEFHA